MSFTRFPCPYCNAVLQAAASTPANTPIRCPKCGEQFRTPSPAEDSDRGITSAEAETPPRARCYPATAPEDDARVLRKIRRADPKSRTVFWVVLGSLAAAFALVLVAGGMAVWLIRSFSPTPSPPTSEPADRAGTAAEWFAKGNRRMQQGDLDGAIGAFTRAIELDPHMAAAYCNRGLARSNKGDFDGGIADSTKSIELNPRDPFPFINRANARICKRVEPDAAIADASHALELRPGIPAALLNLGMARDLKGDYDGAIAEFDKALALLPTFAKAYAQRGRTWLTKKQWDKAEADLTSALELGFAHPLVYEQRGVCRMKQGDRPGAIEDFTGALQLNPGSTDVRVYRAGIYALRNEQEKALADYAAAISGAPKHVAAYLLRGWFYLSLGRADEAAQDADTGLFLAGSRQPQTLYLAILAHCARRLQHPDEARRAVEATSKESKKSWPEPVLRYLHDDMSAEELLRVADSNDRRTEARAYVGVVLWLSGAAEKAREHLEWVRDNGNREFIEYDLALLLLRRLEVGRTQKP